MSVQRNSKGQFLKGVNINDLTGRVFGKLKVREMQPKTTRKTYWICECECGNEKTIRSDRLLGGVTSSCGCVKKQQDDINLIKNHRHQKSGTRLYNIWQNMKNRCYKETDKRYHRYGGRGIIVCEEWQGVDEFLKWASETGYKDNLTIDRIDNDGNYEPSNCKWSTLKEQSNNRRTTHKITYQNKTQSLKEWTEELGLNYGTVHSRLVRGCPLEKVFFKGNLR